MTIGARIRETGAAHGLLRSGIAALIVIASHGLRMLLSLVIIKAIAVHLGASGLAQLGNFMSITSAMAVMSGGGIANGVTKYVAEFADNKTRTDEFLRAATNYGLFYSLGIALICGLFAAPLAETIFGSPVYWWLVIVIGLLQILGLASVIAIGISNGLRRVDLLAAITIPTYLATMPVAYGLVAYLGVAGAALSLALSITATGIPALVVLHRQGFFASILRTRLRRSDYQHLARFSLMLLASATFFPVAETMVRAQISAAMGFEQVGLWQAITRLSTAYLGFFNVYLATRYMPLLARSSATDVPATMARQLLISTGVFAIFAVALFTQRDLVIKLLFSEAFLALADVLVYQLVGDCFRLSSYVVGFLMVARGRSKLYIAAEFVQMALWVFSAYLAVRTHADLETISQFYAAAYLAYFFFVCAMVYLNWKKLQ